MVDCTYLDKCDKELHVVHDMRMENKMSYNVTIIAIVSDFENENLRLK